jgi:hypothetical protein
VIPACVVCPTEGASGPCRTKNSFSWVFKRHRHVWTTPADQGLIFGSVRVLGAVMSSAFYAEDEFRWP